MVRHCPQAGQTICPGLRTVCLKRLRAKEGRRNVKLAGSAQTLWFDTRPEGKNDFSNIADSRVRGIVNLTLGIFIAASRPSVTQEESSYAEGII